MYRNWAAASADAPKVRFISRRCTAHCLTHILWTFSYAKTTCFSSVRRAAVLLFYHTLCKRSHGAEKGNKENDGFCDLRRPASRELDSSALKPTSANGSSFCRRCFLLAVNLWIVLSVHFNNWCGSKAALRLDIQFQKRGGVRLVIWSHCPFMTVIGALQ